MHSPQVYLDGMNKSSLVKFSRGIRHIASLRRRHAIILETIAHGQKPAGLHSQACLSPPQGPARSSPPHPHPPPPELGTRREYVYCGQDRDSRMWTQICPLQNLNHSQSSARTYQDPGGPQGAGRRPAFRSPMGIRAECAGCAPVPGI